MKSNAAEKEIRTAARCLRYMRRFVRWFWVRKIQIGKRATRDIRFYAALYHHNRSLPPSDSTDECLRWLRNAGRLQAIGKKWGYDK